MKKAVCTMLALVMITFLVNPLPGDARGGHWGGHGGGYRGWWVPWAIIGGAALWAAPYYGRYYVPYDAPSTVVIHEPPPVYVQPQPMAPLSSAERIFVYPRQGQDEKQQAADRYECHRWSVGQTGFDPTQPPPGGMPEAELKQNRADYQRALGACLDGRGYTMR